MAKIAKVLQESRLVESNKDSDTIRLWESYREQALLWRAMALIEIPATFLAIVFALWMWNSREIILNVPAKPLPGLYPAQEIPDSEFIDIATDYVNLIATYQPYVAPRQFERARQMVVEPLLTVFNEQMIGVELAAITTTNRTQLFFIDPLKILVHRKGKEHQQTVMVRLPGERIKFIAGRELPAETTTFEVTMKTIPRHSLNPYGIVVINVESRNDKEEG